jgi:hypothetical protein
MSSRDAISPRWPFADGDDGIGLAEGVVVELAGRAIAQRAFGVRLVADRGVFPEGADLVNRRNAQRLAGPGGGDRVERRRVGVDEVGLLVRGDMADAARGGAHQRDLADGGPAGQRRGDGRGAVKGEAVGLFIGRAGHIVFRGGEMDRFPAHPTLRRQKREAAHRIATHQRDRVVEDVKNFQYRTRHH